MRRTWPLALAIALLLAIPSIGSLARADEERWVWAVTALQSAVIRRDHEAVLRLLDDRTVRVLKSQTSTYFEGDPVRLMRFWRTCRHPARNRQHVRIAGSIDRGGCFYRKVVLTENYSYTDGEELPPVENKPVELWVCFMEVDGVIKLRLDHPVHDIIYLLQ